MLLFGSFLGFAVYDRIAVKRRAPELLLEPDRDAGEGQAFLVDLLPDQFIRRGSFDAHAQMLVLLP